MVELILTGMTLLLLFYFLLMFDLHLRIKILSEINWAKWIYEGWGSSWGNLLGLSAIN
jgi:hypothetical protein